jgi:hypothetical protein
MLRLQKRNGVYSTDEGDARSHSESKMSPEAGNGFEIVRSKLTREVACSGIAKGTDITISCSALQARAACRDTFFLTLQLEAQKILEEHANRPRRLLIRDMSFDGKVPLID